MRRIDRDVRPLFRRDQPEAGGMVNDIRSCARAGPDNQLGDFWLGAKVNLISQWPAEAGGVRAARDGQAADGEGRRRRGRHAARSTSSFDAIVSKEVNERVEFSGFAGFIVRGDPGRRRI